MLLRSTICNFVKDLPPETRQRYVDVVKSVPVRTITLEARDKANTVMNGRDVLKVIDEEELERAFADSGIDVTIAAIRHRSFMITPVGELGAFANYEYRTGDKA